MDIRTVKVGVVPITLHIIIDSREPAWIKDWLPKQFPEITFTTQALQEGDYSSDKVIVERKKIGDLDGSIKGRLHDQISRLCTHHSDKLVILAISGSVEDYVMDMERKKPFVKVDEELLHKSVASVMVRDDIRVIWNYHDKKLLKEIVYIIKSVYEDKLDVPHIRNCDMLMARLLNLSKIQYMQIKYTYGTSLCYLCKLSKKQWMSVKGIGAKKADYLIDFFQNGW